MPSKPTLMLETERKTALCYVRKSFTRMKDDSVSPERQRANIVALCERNGWTPEWYEDIQGHRSGRFEKNRPQWLALKARLGDPDVAALVANDLSRLHRKGWRIGDLIEFLNEYDVNLALAAPGREVDTRTIRGRMFLQFGAIVDEYYAEDISQRAKDNVAYRKAHGKSIGIPPFGTRRNQEGYLCPTTKGAWLLPDGQFVAGTQEKSPADGALWRGYYDAATRILTLYVEKNIGLEKLTYTLNEEGWAFRDRKGEPRPFCRDDVRRVIANWPEYGGAVVGTRSKDRPAYDMQSIDDVALNEERAVFPVSLLRRVAQIRKERSFRPLDQSVKRRAHAYPLSALTYCANCARNAEAQNNPTLRTLLTGNTDAKGMFRYRHKQGVRCGCTNRSILCEAVEQDFARILQLLTIRPEKKDLMTRLALEMDAANGKPVDEGDLEKEKAEAIAICRRRIDAAVVLFGDGMIDRDEYRRRVEHNEREIAHWQTRTTETQKVALELAMCVEAVERLARLWEVSNDEDKQGLARSLFTEIVYDLDTRRIVSFKLKPWADRFVVVREALYEVEDGTNGSGSGSGNDMGKRPHRGT